jgi:hypothetical protein
VGTLGADGISFPRDLWEVALVSGTIHPQGLLEKEEEDKLAQQVHLSSETAMSSPRTLLSSL